MKETIVSFNITNLITIGIMVFVFSAIVAAGVRVYANFRGTASD